MIEDAIRLELEQLGVESVAPGQTALAISLAAAIDGAKAPTAKAVAGRELRTLMQTLRELAPVRSQGDQVDELKAKRKARRGA
jgi:hypothetical protein